MERFARKAALGKRNRICDELNERQLRACSVEKLRYLKAAILR